METKSAEHLSKAAVRQLFNYLRATDLEIGLLLYFGPEAKFYRVICENRRGGASRSHGPAS